MRTPEELSKIIDRYDLKSAASTRELELVIRKSWSVREILLLFDFKLFCEVVAQDKDEHGVERRLWSMGCSGMVVRSYAEYQVLERMLDRLLRTCYVYLGAAAMLGVMEARLLGGCLFADEGDGPTLYDMTLSQLIHMVPIEKAKRLDVVTRIDHLQKTADDIDKKVTNPTPSKRDYGVSAMELSMILEKLGAGRSARTIQLWEKYLNSNGSEGTKPPMDYNLYTRLNLQTATAWAQNFASLDKAKLKTKVSIAACRI